MDTRRKILSLAGARQLEGPLTVVAGYFDVLRVDHVREVAAIRSRGRALLAIVLPKPAGYLPQRARAELAAGLACVDYVVEAGLEDLDLPGAAEVMPLDCDDAATADLIERVKGTRDAKIVNQ